MTNANSRDDLRILPAAPSDSATVAQLLADAFSTDGHTVGLLPESERAKRLRRQFDLTVDATFVAGGHVWIALDADSSDALGAALWEAPGKHVPRWHTLRHAPAYARIFGTRLIDAMRTDQIAGSHHPKIPHWYLRDLGTSPAARGRGVASALLRHRIAAADAEGIGIYLESSSRRNVGFYQRFGFVERGVIPAHGTVDLTGMWRPPAAPDEQPDDPDEQPDK